MVSLRVQHHFDITKDYPSYAHRTLDDITQVVFHRFGPELNGVPVVHAQQVIDFFRRDPHFGRPAYTYVIWQNGTVDQLVPLNWATPHARVYNRHSVGVAVIGDFREEQPTPKQVWASTELLAAHMQLGPILVSGHHPQLHDSSFDPTKDCPGKLFPLAQIYHDAVRIWSKEHPHPRDLQIALTDVHTEKKK